MSLFIANIEVTMLDADTAEWLSTDADWLNAMYEEAKTQAVNAGKTPNGDPELIRYNQVTVTDDGILYNFEFNVPVAYKK